jgi:hypothetical protein
MTSRSGMSATRYQPSLGTLTIRPHTPLGLGSPARHPKAQARTSAGLPTIFPSRRCRAGPRPRYAFRAFRPRRGDRSMHLDPGHDIAAHLGRDPVHQRARQQPHLRRPRSRLGLDRELAVHQLHRPRVAGQIRPDHGLPGTEDASLGRWALPAPALDQVRQQYAERLRIAGSGPAPEYPRGRRPPCRESALRAGRSARLARAASSTPAPARARGARGRVPSPRPQWTRFTSPSPTV